MIGHHRLVSERDGLPAREPQARLTQWRPEVQGWSSDILPFYDAVAAELSDGSSAVEVGVYKGRSVLYLAEALCTLGKTRCEVFAIDRFESPTCPTLWQQFLRNLSTSSAEVREVVTPIRGSSVPTASQFADASLDVVFIDATHQYESVRDDLAAWSPKVRPGGILAGHDYSGDMRGRFPGVDKAVHERFTAEHVVKFPGTVWMVRS